MKHSVKAKALILILFVALICVISSAALILAYNNRNTSYTAYIYQDGKVIYEIPLSAVTESYELTVTSAEGGTNTVQVTPGSIGILQADCPDKICVNQGFIRNSLLPITCLPHHLVIELKADDFSEIPADVDAITH